ncbi:MAG: hypothetical protein CMH54_03330 [Myxococcales bacterium]|nr:hypothetical protein [Myxococcales bacterium]|tara:strand:+ start:568 stop:1767 length:1200 start_codon:yes stop_codon:yes gene_type:complete
MNTGTHEEMTAGYSRDDGFGIYVHFPFCVSRCTYCDFVVTTPPEIPDRAYTTALIDELASRVEHFAGRRLVSLYFGGGTPSLWSPDELRRFFEAVRETVPCDALEEVTLEANPGDLSPALLDTLVDTGINRLSIGVQTLHDGRLRDLSRRHTTEDALQSVAMAVEHPGLKSVSADLIYGLSGSTVESVSGDLETLLQLNVPHLSIYALMLEPNTPMYHQVHRGVVNLPPDDTVADQAEAIYDRIEDSPLEMYEISNAGLPGHYAVHNSLYWHMRPYLGLGVGAHGLEPRGANLVRRVNGRKVAAYLEAPTRPDMETTMEAGDWLKDALLVRPRWLSGFQMSDFQPWTNSDTHQALSSCCDALVEGEMLHKEGDNYRLTRRGWLLYNDVVLKLYAAIDGG